MYISEINIEKFRHLENEKLGPFTFNNISELTVFAGPNGSGKSSVLELIGYALSNSYSLVWSLSRTFDGFSFEIGIGLTPKEKEIVVASLVSGLEYSVKQIDDKMLELDGNALLATHERERQKKIFKDSIERQYKYHQEIIDYFKTNDVYYRAFEYNSGEYAKNPGLQNNIHRYVTSELKDKLRRSLGFFLRADRSYPQKAFEREKIFSFDNVKKKEYLWEVAFNTSEIQYRDMYEFLVQQRYHYLRELGNYHNQKSKGVEGLVEPVDPIIPYENLLEQIFPDYKFADKNESVPSNLFIELPSKEIITFNDLSSGEKEVFFILSFFIRHNVENAIIVIDEPELHLHPELSRILIRSIKSIRNGNQIWVATHNSEIIDEAGRDRVIYVERDLTTRKANFVAGDKEDDVILQLKNLFGFSGYIGVAKNLVFLEGDNSSPDRKFYSTLFPKKNSSFKLIPSNGSRNLNRLNAAILSILDANLGWMNFFLVRDRDYLTSEMVEKYKNHSSGRVFVLEKHEIENYLLDFKIISKVLSEIFNIKKSEEELERMLFNICLKLSSQVVREMISFRLNLFLNPQDFSIGQVLNGAPYFDKQVEGCEIIESRSQIIKDKFKAVSDEINISLTTSLSKKSIESIISECELEVKTSLENSEWINLFPGKEMLESLSKKLGISNIISFQNSIIKEFSNNEDRINYELKEIFTKITRG